MKLRRVYLSKQWPYSYGPYDDPPRSSTDDSHRSYYHDQRVRECETQSLMMSSTILKVNVWHRCTHTEPWRYYVRLTSDSETKDHTHPNECPDKRQVWPDDPVWSDGTRCEVDTFPNNGNPQSLRDRNNKYSRLLCGTWTYYRNYHKYYPNHSNNDHRSNRSKPTKQTKEVLRSEMTQDRNGNGEFERCTGECCEFTCGGYFK
jgi:hypothetical protein